MKPFLLLSVVLLLSLPLPLPADETTHTAAVQELLKVTKAEQLLIQSLSSMEDAQKQIVAQLIQGKDQDTARAIADQVLKTSNEIIMSKLSWTTMEAHYTRVYMKYFTEDEVRGMVDFYKSPLGQKVLEKTPALMGDIIQMTSSKVDEVMPEIQAASKKAADEVVKKKAPAPTPTSAPAV